MLNILSATAHLEIRLTFASNVKRMAIKKSTVKKATPKNKVAPKKKVVKKKPKKRISPKTHAKAKPGDKRLGNNFWEIRSKHGRDQLFATSALMWEAAVEYFNWCIKNPLIEIEMKSMPVGGNLGSRIQQVKIPKMRVFTMQGLCSYLDCNTHYFNDFKKTLKPKQKDFSLVISRIEETIYNQKFTGASSGFFNANIIARDLALVDHKKEDGETIQYQVPLTKEELDEARKAINDKI